MMQPKSSKQYSNNCVSSWEQINNKSRRKKNQANKYSKYNKNLRVPPCYDLEFIAHLLETIKNRREQNKSIGKKTALMNPHCAQSKLE